MRRARWCLVATFCWIATTVVAGERPPRTVKVSAQSEFRVAPDEVVLTLDVHTRDDENLLAAKAANNKITRTVLALADRYKIPAERFQIDQVQMGPQYNRHDDDKPRYYFVSREIEIVLREMEQLEPLISDAMAAGATRVHGILFRTTKHREHQIETRQRAVAYAKEKAGHLAELNGLKLGKAIEIEEQVEGDHHTTGGGYGMGGGMSISGGPEPTTPPRRAIPLRFVGETRKAGKAAAPSAEPSQPLAPGQISIYATVTITFEMLE